MITRKEFLQGIPAILSVPFIASLAGSCSPAGILVRAASHSGKVTIPAGSFPDAADRETYTRVFVDNQTNPVYVYRNAGGSLIAVSGTCSHKGCGVKKTRTGFECPCHGSEYDLEGGVIHGPAAEPLRTFAVMETPETAEFDQREGR
jgi:Rieske Fe-S protein